MNKVREKKRAAFSSVIVGLLLTGMKLTVGILTGSLGILSEALHSLLDLGAALITFFSVRFSERPPDESHPYGHGKIENLSALAEALLLFGTCAWIVWEAVDRLTGKVVTVEATFWAFFVMGVSLLLDVYISQVLRRAARKYRSQALEADALHYGSDILSSAVVIVGLVGVRLGVPALDPVAALGVAALVAVASVRLSWQAVEELLDRAPKGLPEKIMARLKGLSEPVSVSRVRVRRSGSSTFIDIVAAAGRLTPLDKTHALADRIEAEVRTLVPLSDVLVHFDPTSDGESLLETSRAVALECCPQIRDIHNVQSYFDKNRGGYFLSMHVRLDPSLSIEEAHAVTERLEASLRDRLSTVEMIEIHVEMSESVGDGTRTPVAADGLEALRRTFADDGRIREIHDVFRHQSTKGAMISCHVLVACNLSLEEAHAIASDVEARIKDIFPDTEDVIVHTEPTDP